MASGSAAMDGTWPGHAPASGDYRLVWRGPAPQTGYVAPFRDKLYEVISRVGPTSSQGVVALNAETGVELWYQPISVQFTFAVTSAGVVVGIPDSFDTDASPTTDASILNFHVVLLNLETGTPIWASAESYRLSGSIYPVSAQIAGDTVLFVDGKMTLVAIDFATGLERWRVESSELPAGDCDCFAAGPAISAGIIYFHNPVTGQIVAVSVSTGEQKWAVDDHAGPVVLSSGGTVISPSITLAAVEQGVVVNTWGMSDSGGFFGLLSATDGSVIWQWSTDKAVRNSARAGAALIVIMRDPGATEWHLERVDLATGQVLKTSSQTFSDAFFLSSLPEADVVLVRGRSNEAVGIDPVTLDVTWTKPAIDDCAILLPVLPDGGLACRTTDGLAVYEPAPASTTPAANSDEVTSIPVENGDFLAITEPGVLLLEDPTVGAEIAEVYDEGTVLQYVGKASVGADGTIWYMVRNPKTARAGWIPAAYLRPEK